MLIFHIKFPGMAAHGALFAGIIADIYGRKKAIMLGDIINTIGAIICCAAFTKWILLIGVIFLGLATGILNLHANNYRF